MKKISIISVVYNAIDNIENMIKSVIYQQKIYIEFIIIDGKSNDGTVDIIKKYQQYIDYWISEPDKGIYNAMNKGIQKATGDYVYFLGADDYLNNGALDKVVQYLDGKTDIICGKVYLVDKLLNIKKTDGKFLSKQEILNGQMAPHQGMFMKRELALKYKFNEEYRIASDYELFLHAILDGAKVQFIDLIIANYSIQGLSSTNTKKLKEEYISILKKYGLDKSVKYFIKKNQEKKWKMLIKNILRTLKLERYVKCLLGWQKF
ncbi:glycosyltransferase family 2 protein [Megamonas funiformis]|uniref:glycosyltransferase family 2 protein n=1 Tax=Megamonas funiformis TaxID=437897 RepID=UPI00265CCED0|nr:glycosyltransferase family 2 protein [Megamonas funiformis]